MSTGPHALLFGDDEMLNLTRRWILERTGCVVLTAKAPGEVRALCEAYPVDLLVLCYTSLPQDSDGAIAAAEDRRPGVKKLWLRQHGKPAPVHGDTDTMLSTDGPHELFVAVRKMVESLRDDL